MILFRLLAFAFGVYLVAVTVFSAVATFVVPRNAPQPNHAARFFIAVRRIFFSPAQAHSRLPAPRRGDGLLRPRQSAHARSCVGHAAHRRVYPHVLVCRAHALAECVPQRPALPY